MTMEEESTVQQAIDQQLDDFQDRLAARIASDGSDIRRQHSDLWCGRFNLSSRALVFILAGIINLVLLTTSITLIFLYPHDCELLSTAVSLITLIVGIWTPTPYSGP